MSPKILALAFLSITLTALAQVALRKTMLASDVAPTSLATFGRMLMTLPHSPWFVLGVTCYVISLALWLVVLAKTEVSFAYPLSSFGFILTALIGYFYLNEALGPTRLAGICLICSGIFVLARSA